MREAMKNSRCDGSRFCSSYGVCITHTIWFNEAGSRGSRMACACPCHSSSLMDLQMPSLRALFSQAGTFLTKCGLD